MNITSRILLTALCALTTAFTASAQVKKPIVKVPFTICKPGNYYLAKSIAINSKNGPARVSDNYAVSWATGYDPGPGVYRGNDATACAVTYKGDTDGGGNK